MDAILKEIGLYMFYLYILLLIAYGNKDPSSHGVFNSMESVFVNADYNGITRFDSVSQPLHLI